MYEISYPNPVLRLIDKVYNREKKSKEKSSLHVRFQRTQVYGINHTIGNTQRDSYSIDVVIITVITTENKNCRL
jgi:hypothetical protein